MKKLLPFIALGALLANALHANLLPEAVLAFPAQTTALEYDSLSTLRALPNYKELRKQYASAGLQRTQKDLLLLGVTEDQITEVVMAAGPNGFFGLLAGTFRATSASEAVKQGMTTSALDEQSVFCAKDGICFLFLTREGGRLAFGTHPQLRAISEVRQGLAPSLSANSTFTNLINRMEPHSPVFGVAPGSEIGLWVGDSIPKAFSSRLDLTKMFASIDTFAYSVIVDSKVHVVLSLLCSSDRSAALLGTTLTAMSGLERAAISAGVAPLPFNNVVVNSTSRFVAVRLDTSIR